MERLVMWMLAFKAKDRHSRLYEKSDGSALRYRYEP